MSVDTIISAIDNAPYNMGVSGTDWLATEGNVALCSGDDVMLFEPLQSDVYEGHLLLKSRGREAVTWVQQCYDTMFDEYGAELLIGLVPVDRRDVRLFMRWTGARPVFLNNTEYGQVQVFVVSPEMRKRD